MRTSRLYRRNEKAFRLWCAWSNAYLAEHFPDTGGCELYVHNWYRCSRDAERAQRGGEAIDYIWERWYRIKRRYERLYDRAFAQENPNHLCAKRGVYNTLG